MVRVKCPIAARAAIVATAQGSHGDLHATAIALATTGATKGWKRATMASMLRRAAYVAMTAR